MLKTIKETIRDKNKAIASFQNKNLKIKGQTQFSNAFDKLI